jgi:hypothetical protein
MFDVDLEANNRQPVNLLRDGRGVYGIGVSDGFDNCGVEHKHVAWPFRTIVVRPDILGDSSPYPNRPYPVLQKITGGFRRGPFMHSSEEALRKVIHHWALERAGLRWPPHGDTRWWSTNEDQKARNRQTYHGLRLGSLSVINKLVERVLVEAAHTDAMSLARRFCFRSRFAIYQAGSRSPRALQLADTFPVLAHRVYCVSRKEAKEAVDLIERGARLRDVATVMGVPMALRNIHPGAAHLVSEAFNDQNQNLIRAFMPASLRGMRGWLRAVAFAHAKAGAEFVERTARNVLHIPAGNAEEILFHLNDIGDWIRACRPGVREPLSPDLGERFVVRPFTWDMSVKTVTTLSAQWHEAIASCRDGPQYAFPTPWFSASKMDDYEFVPLDNAGDLYREGAIMHHCAGTYAPEVSIGYSYVYSVRLAGERVATLELVRQSKAQVVIAQIRGPCNARVSKRIAATAHKWLQAQVYPKKFEA